MRKYYIKYEKRKGKLLPKNEEISGGKRKYYFILIMPVSGISI